MIELLLFVVILICNLNIANEWAKYSLIGISLQRPLNGRVIGAILIATISLLFTKLLQRSGVIEADLITAQNSLSLTTILLGISMAWLVIKRYVIMPRGKFAYNQAITETIYWSITYYRPGVSLKEEAVSLKNYSLADRALKLFQYAIKVLETETFPASNKQYINFYDNVPLNSLVRRNIATAYEEMAFLYRMMDDFKYCHRSLDRALIIVNSLLESENSNPDYLRLKSLILFRHAEAYQAEGIEKETARKFYQESLEIENKFGTTNDIEFTHDLLLKLELS